MRGKQQESTKGTATANAAASDASAGRADDLEAIDVAEHLRRDLARVRAKFGLDPVLVAGPLAAPWTSDPALEEDEAEFVDTLADCLGAGLSLEDALNCWDTGDLAMGADADLLAGGADAADADGEAEDHLEDQLVIGLRPEPAARPFSNGNRVFVR